MLTGGKPTPSWEYAQTRGMISGCMVNFLVRLTAIMLLLAIAATVSWAEAGPAGGLVVVDLGRAVTSSRQGKKVLADLMGRADVVETELRALAMEIERIRKDITIESLLTPDEMIKAKQRELRDKIRFLNERQRTQQLKFQGEKEEALGKVRKGILKVLGRMARENGYGAIVDSSELLFYSPVKM